MRDKRLVERRRVRGSGWRKGDKVYCVSPVVAGKKSCFLKVTGLERGSAGVFVIVLIACRRGRTIKRVAVEAEVLRAQALAGFFVGRQIHDRLSPSLQREIRTVVCIEAQAGVVEVVARGDRWAPIDDPAALWPEAVIDLLL